MADFYKSRSDEERRKEYERLSQSGQSQQAAAPAKPMGFFDTLKQNIKQEFDDGFGILDVPRALGTTAIQKVSTPPSEDKSFVRKVGEGLVRYGVGLPLALSRPIELIKSLPSLVYTEEEGIGGETKKSIKDIFNKQYYEDDPVGAVLNTGSWVASIGTAGLSKVAGSIAGIGTKMALKEVAIQGAEVAIKKSVMKNAVRTAIKTGDASIVRETVYNNLLKGVEGMDKTVARNAAEKAMTAVQQEMVSRAGRIKIFDSLAHPLKTTGNIVSGAVDPIKRAVFGAAPDAAVTKLYGASTVAKDPEGFLKIERWAGAQAEERGLVNNSTNRQRIMMEWQSNDSEFARLTPEQRVAYHKNYVESDMGRKRLYEATRELTVTGRGVSPSVEKSLVANIADAPQGATVGSFIGELEDIFGGTVKSWRQTLLDGLDETAILDDSVKAVLTERVARMSKPQSLAFPGNKEAQKIIKEIEEQTGYVIVKAPKGKKVSFAADIEGSAPGVGVEDLSSRTRLGTLLDRLGLSARGGAEGTTEFLYKDGFNQRAMKELTQKYGETLTFTFKDTLDGSPRKYTIPVEHLYDFLERNRKNIANVNVGKWVQGVPYSVFDMTKKDLKAIGFSDELASDVLGISKRSLVNWGDPFTKGGLGEGIANMFRAYFPGYNSYLKTAYHWRFNKNPFFGIQSYIEMEFNAGLYLKSSKVSLPGKLSAAAKVAEKVPFLKKLVAPQNEMWEKKLVDDMILSKVNRSGIEFASNPELMAAMKSGSVSSGVSKLGEAADFNRSIQSQNIFLRGVGYNMTESATSFSKAIARKYGMDLKDALGNATGKFDNPSVANEIINAVTTVYSNEPGFLTSPLVKTLNIVWFPFRFQAKTAINTARWLSSLNPISRMSVVNSWAHFAEWADTKEGIKYREENSALWHKLIDYTFAYESMGKSLASALEGQLFDGTVGKIGGMPFGQIFDILGDLAIIPERSISTRKALRKDTPKDIISTATASVIVEDLIYHMMPHLPLQQLTAGNMQSLERPVKDAIRGGTALVGAMLTGKKTEGAKTRLNRDFKKIPYERTR